MRHALLFLMVGTAFLAAPVAADEPIADVHVSLPWECLPGPDCQNPPCIHLAGAWTSASQPRVDVYVSKVIHQKIDPTEPLGDDWTELLDDVLAAARQHLDDVEEARPPTTPGAINGRGIVVQVELTVPEMADNDGLRLTFQVDVLGCLGE